MMTLEIIPYTCEIENLVGVIRAEVVVESSSIDISAKVRLSPVVLKNTIFIVALGLKPAII